MQPSARVTARALACLLLAGAGACRSAGGGVPTVSLDPLAAGPPGGAALAAVAFLAGCWRGSFGSSGVIEERWSPPAGNLMQYTTRFLRDGRAVDFEFGTITPEEGGVVLLPYPRGNRSAHGFLLTTITDGRAVFEAPEHDYPKRIVYERRGVGTLLARIDGGESDPEPRSWSMDAVPCP